MATGPLRGINTRPWATTDNGTRRWPGTLLAALSVRVGRLDSRDIPS